MAALNSEPHISNLTTCARELKYYVYQPFGHMGNGGVHRGNPSSPSAQVKLRCERENGGLSRVVHVIPDRSINLRPTLAGSHSANAKFGTVWQTWIRYSAYCMDKVVGNGVQCSSAPTTPGLSGRLPVVYCPLPVPRSIRNVYPQKLEIHVNLLHPQLHACECSHVIDPRSGGPRLADKRRP